MWMHTSHVMALLANAHGADPPLGGLDFFPFDQEERKEAEKNASTIPNPLGIEALKMLVAPKSRQR